MGVVRLDTAIIKNVKSYILLRGNRSLTSRSFNYEKSQEPVRTTFFSGLGWESWSYSSVGRANDC